MDFDLTDEQERFRESVVAFANRDLNDDVIRRDAIAGIERRRSHTDEDQIRPRDPDRRLRAALALRIARDARRDRQPVVPPDGHDLRVADRDPAHVIDRDRPLVVGLLCPAALCGR